MRLLIDLGSIKTGGGAQLALNFLDWMKENEGFSAMTFLLLPEKGPLANFEYNKDFIQSQITYPDNYFLRKWFEITKLRKFVENEKITHIFTFFGSGLPKYPNVKSLVSVAYPVICYPESPFWKYFPLKKRIRLIIVNYLRSNRIKRADYVLAETEVMRNRLIKYIGIDSKKIYIYPPVPSLYVANSNYNKPLNDTTLRYLFLSGVDNHKNLWRLPDIATELLKIGFLNFKFVLTVDKNAYTKKYKTYLYDKTETLDRHFEFLGSVSPAEINRVYLESNFLVNISDLESFSNNYMEAWKAGVPLICSDTDFSRNICQDSAIYIPPHNTKVAAEIIFNYAYDYDDQIKKTHAGKKLLDNLPNLTQRAQFIFNLLSEL
jgi:glycosyltransferase involved in cell wall biosynthesis